MSAGVASARWSGFVSHPSVVASSGGTVGSGLLAEGIAPELEAVGIVDDAAGRGGRLRRGGGRGGKAESGGGGGRGGGGANQKRKGPHSRCEGAHRPRCAP